MSEIFKKIKSVFVVEEEAGSASNASQQAATPTPTAAPTAAAPAHSTAQTASHGGAISQKFQDILFSAIEKNNQEGFDYFEFKQALRNLAKMQMDEATRFQSAHAMAQTMGVTSAKLVESASFYLQILGAEQSKFNEAHAQQRVKLIGGREEEIKNLETAVQQKTEQIRQLTHQIEEHRQKSEQIRREINDSTVKIESTRADFDVTFAAIAGQIQDDISKIKQYLK